MFDFEPHPSPPRPSHPRGPPGRGDVTTLAPAPRPQQARLEATFGIAFRPARPGSPPPVRRRWPRETPCTEKPRPTRLEGKRHQAVEGDGRCRGAGEHRWEGAAQADRPVRAAALKHQGRCRLRPPLGGVSRLVVVAVGETG